MALIMLLVVFAILMFLGAPVAITMIGSSLVYILLEPSMNFSNVATKIVTSVTGTSLITLPLFIMAGEIMNSSGVTERLFRFPLTLIGHIRGGLAHVNVLASMLFAGMSGAAIADTAGLGKIEMDIMEKEGYDKGFSAGITAASSTIGPIIPPSNTLVVYAVAVEVSVAQDNFGVCVTAGNLYESIDITGKVLIDATGNSEAIYQLSPQATEKTPKEQQQGVTMMFALSNVDMPRFLENLDRDKLAEIIRRGIEAKAFPYRIFTVCPLPGTQSISVNMTRVPDVDVESIEDMSAALMEARSQIQCAVPYICKNVRGCEKAYLSSIASSLGVRERRKIVGQQLLKGEDLVQCTSFSDAVALGSYPVDIHRSDSSHAVQFVSIGGSGIYEIPFHCMVTKQFGNVLAGGKNVYADDMAFGAMRTMPTVMGIGNAAGLAAAVAARGNHDLRTMSIEPVQETLRKVDYPDSAERF